ncbi:DoxX family protein [soil metagenome]
MVPTGIAERIAYGRPLDLDDERADDAPIHLVPRSGTALVGRILIAAIFIVSGIAKLTDTAGAAGYMTAVGIPNADVLAVIAGIADVAGGIAILSGFLTRLAALGLIAVLIPTTLLFHAFWTLDGAEAKAQMVNFMKNLAILGGLAMVFANGPGRYSIDAKLRRPMQP